MVTQEIVKYQTANLAKTKGFNENSAFYYDVEHCELSRHYEDEWCNSEIENGLGKLKFPMISAPSQVILQKWLRDEHNIEVYVTVNFYNRKEKLGYLYNIDKFDAKNIHDGQTYDDEQIQLIGEFQGFITFEQALEVGLFKALNLITKC
jgi:hypothetical protein